MCDSIREFRRAKDSWERHGDGASTSGTRAGGTLFTHPRRTIRERRSHSVCMRGGLRQERTVARRELEGGVSADEFDRTSANLDSGVSAQPRLQLAGPWVREMHLAAQIVEVEPLTGHPQ